ncbi:substrate-binding domain-containing protein [Saccharothrix sp. NRRL B-16348]|uniref:substrate-binding domain-containing protein n=1 Tax=Saccharothrix sp. NRRL B-16348 TaxID=1415542 RepID=UPI0012F71F73|nr:substrate-binding domain-containing protein [Saccharothrix sp. NRRL B-16348]
MRRARLLWLWRRRPKFVVAAGAVVVVVLAGLVVLRVWDRPVRPDTDATVVDRVEFDPAPGVEWSSALPACAPGAEFRSVTLASSADKNRPLAELAGDYGARLVGGECVAIRVTPANSGEYAKRLSGPWNSAWGPRPDVWVPASSVWLRLARHWAAPSAVGARCA